MAPPYLSPFWQGGFGLLNANKKKINWNSIDARPVGERGGALHSSTGGWGSLFKACGRAFHIPGIPHAAASLSLWDVHAPGAVQIWDFPLKSAGIGAGAAQRLWRHMEAWPKASECVWRLLGWDFKVGFLLGLKPAHFRPSWGWIKQGKMLRAGAATSCGYSAAGRAGLSAPGFSMFSQTEPPDLQADQAQLCRLFSASSAWPFLHSGPGMPSRDLLGAQDPDQCPFTGTRVAQMPHEDQNLQTQSLFYI